MGEKRKRFQGERGGVCRRGERDRVAGGERDRVLGRKGRGSREKAVGFVGQKGTGFLREREGLKGEPQVFHS